MSKRFRIEMDGGASMPRVYDAATGEAVGVTDLKVEWDIKTKIPRLTLTTFRFEASITADADRVAAVSENARLNELHNNIPS